MVARAPQTSLHCPFYSTFLHVQGPSSHSLALHSSCSCPTAVLAAPCPSLPLPSPDPPPTMHPSFDAASSLSTASAEGSLEQQQLVHAATSPPSPPPRGTRAAGGGIIRCQDCWLLAKADGCAHRRCRTCCTGRGFACPAHVRPTSSHVPASTAAAAAVAPSRKRPRALDSVATPSTSSSVGQPATAALEGFAREVRLDAVFRRVRLGPDDAEVAYHATVTIGGHVFRGVLYDVGPHGRRRRSAASTDTGGSSGVSSQSTAGGGSGGLDLTLRL
ncbi:unnamed protein product [Urochloa decumbens]|uniref:Uncharacterized protein n=1 Tax=Urochloa decumbens TaxID=240449 RepID=A0ABC9G374_9POAL